MRQLNVPKLPKNTMKYTRFSEFQKKFFVYIPKVFVYILAFLFTFHRFQNFKNRFTLSKHKIQQRFSGVKIISVRKILEQILHW